MTYKKACDHCGIEQEFIKDIKSWKCPICGGQNPKVSPVMTIVIFLILMYLFLQFMFWVFGV